MRPLKIICWRALALISLLLGVIGIFLPIMPTVPFVLLAAWAAGKGWPTLEAWLLNHHHFGDHIRQWRANGAVPRKAKWIATLAMACSAVMMQFLPLPDPIVWARWAVPAVFVLVLIWLWQRPEPLGTQSLTALKARDTAASK
ncbi:MAG TPA: YbaN family protein [Rhodocyclaceae bacterium]|nr:YbaN family protein [Rhodocyclaceae bacterium]